MFVTKFSIQNMFSTLSTSIDVNDVDVDTDTVSSSTIYPINSPFLQRQCSREQNTMTNTTTQTQLQSLSLTCAEKDMANTWSQQTSSAETEEEMWETVTNRAQQRRLASARALLKVAEREALAAEIAAQKLEQKLNNIITQMLDHIQQLGKLSNISDPITLKQLDEKKKLEREEAAKKAAEQKVTEESVAEEKKENDTDTDAATVTVNETSVESTSAVPEPEPYAFTGILGTSSDIPTAPALAAGVSFAPTPISLDSIMQQTNNWEDNPYNYQYDPNATYWPKGTGYGYADSGWNIDEYIAAQKQKEQEMVNILIKLTEDFLTLPINDARCTQLLPSLADSCLILFLESYLLNDSFTDIQEQHLPLYSVIYQLVEAMLKHATFHECFTKVYYGQRTPLSAHIQALGSQVATIQKLSKTSDAANVKETCEEARAKNLMELISRVASMVNDIAVSTESVRPDTTSITQDESKVDSLLDYAKIMEQYRFGEVEAFGPAKHHYADSYTEVANRKFVRRLATEYTDLSKSLPINVDSSIVMRVHDTKMSMCQILVFAPPDTPYAHGAFLFDCFFPSDYPNCPPQVNLQTTGYGSVRFNPNLYHCGKVCLSILGTWSGGNGEGWSAATSTFLQVAISIQALVFVPQPYFNEPGYESSMNTDYGRKASDAYNQPLYAATIKYAMIDIMKNPPVGFENAIRTHFALQKERIMKQARKWAENNAGVEHLLVELADELNKQQIASEKPLSA